MTFKHLEDGLKSEENLNKYFAVYSGLQEPTRTTLSYALDLASYLQSVNLGDDYIVFGGYAVLSHLMKELGEDVAKIWRGSNDVDMAGTTKALNAIRAGYDITGDRPSQNLDDKRTIKLTEDHEQECKIDFYMGDFEDRFFPPEVNTHFGIDFKVSNPLSLIRGKLYTPQSELVHSTDILRMMAVLERRGNSPENVARFFTSEQKKVLAERLKQSYDAVSADRMDFVPSEAFMSNIKKQLHRGRPLSNH
jgi:hypothetical protein